jgi:hypothetical protein
MFTSHQIFIRVTRGSRRKNKWVGNVGRMILIINIYKILSVQLKRTYHLENLGVNRWIILKSMLKYWLRIYELNSSASIGKSFL